MPKAKSQPSSHTKPLKVALVCDWLTTPGGAEKLLLELHRMYPDAPIYTSQYKPKGITWFQNADVRTGWLQIFPSSLRKLLGPLRQLYFSHLDLSSYDLVISVTGAEAKSVQTKRPSHKSSRRSPDQTKSSASPNSAYHICYCHVPTQYYWQMYDKYIENPGFGILSPIIRLAFKLLVNPLRKADYAAAQRPDQFVTISTYSAQQIQTYYHRESIVIAPPVDTNQFARRPNRQNPQFFHQKHQLSHKKSTTFPQEIHNLSTAFPQKSTGFSTSFPQETPEFSTANPSSTPVKPFVISCRQVTWKRVDLAISACLAAQLPLKVIGDGPEHKNLVKLAANSPLITFLPWLNSVALAEQLQSSVAYLFPSLEPFGIAAVEALAAGCPVIAYTEGGSRDFIQPGKNGLLFSKQTPDSLTKALRSFHPQDFDPKLVAQSAQKYYTSHFQQKFTHLVQTKLGKHYAKTH